jgi:hypothetical protein
MRLVGRMYDDGSCAVLAWGLEVDLLAAGDPDVGPAALAAIADFRQTGYVQLLLFDDNGDFLGTSIDALPEPQR